MSSFVVYKHIKRIEITSLNSGKTPYLSVMKSKGEYVVVKCIGKMPMINMYSCAESNSCSAPKVAAEEYGVDKTPKVALLCRGIR